MTTSPSDLSGQGGGAEGFAPASPRPPSRGAQAKRALAPLAAVGLALVGVFFPENLKFWRPDPLEVVSDSRGFPVKFFSQRRIFYISDYREHRSGGGTYLHGKVHVSDEASGTKGETVALTEPVWLGFCEGFVANLRRIPGAPEPTDIFRADLTLDTLDTGPSGTKGEAHVSFYVVDGVCGLADQGLAQPPSLGNWYLSGYEADNDEGRLTVIFNRGQGEDLPPFDFKEACRLALSDGFPDLVKTREAHEIGSISVRSFTPRVGFGSLFNIGTYRTVDFTVRGGLCADGPEVAL